MYIKTEPAVSGSGRERLKAALYGGQILFPGGECVEELLPLLFAKGAVCAVATRRETETQSHQYYICSGSIQLIPLQQRFSNPGLEYKH